MRVDLMTREYPPEVYGGAGVHVARLTEVLRAGQPPIDVRVHCFGAPRDEAGTTAYAEPAELATANAALRVLGTDLAMAAATDGTDLVHSHTWYAGIAGHLAALLQGVPHVTTAHSLEPLRPWKADQLGGGYALSSWAERTALEGAAAVIAVSAAMREDVLRCYPAVDPAVVHVVSNGVDTTVWQPDHDTDRLVDLGVDPARPSVVFVGRITKQKGLPHLLRAATTLPPEVQLVLCAGQPDTPEIAAEVSALVEALRTGGAGPRDVIWIERMLPRQDVIQLLTHATVFACPSIYEPQGIVNLEAMACGTAVVASATGGIPEVVDDGVTGVLVPIEQVPDGTGTPVDPAGFEAALGEALAAMVADPARAQAMGGAGRERAVGRFSWQATAAATRTIYDAVLAD